MPANAPDVNILFLSHNSGLSGAPLVLLRLMESLKADGEASFDVLLLKGGKLKRAFRKAARDLYFFTPRPETFSLRDKVVAGVAGENPVATHRRKLARELRGKGYDLIYCNSAATVEALDWVLEQLEAPVILHVHELESVLRQDCEPERLHRLLPRLSSLIAVSGVVEQNLIANHGVPLEKVERIPEFLTQAVGADESAAQRIRGQFGIPAGAFMVGGCGSVNWRKGYDLFIQVAAEAFRELGAEAPLYFLWLGGAKELEARRAEIDHDLAKLGLRDRVFFPGAQPNPMDYFAAFDLFLMTSREDPFPLVCLENATMGNPIICFADAVGSEEYIDDEVGAVVPYGDPRAMALALIDLYHDEKRRTAASQEIARRAGAYAAERVIPRLKEHIKKVVAEQNLRASRDLAV